MALATTILQSTNQSTETTDILIVDGLCYLPDPENLDYLAAARSSGVSTIHITAARIGDDALQSLARLGRWRRMLRARPDLAILVEKAADVFQAHREHKVGVILGWQNAPLEFSLDLVDAFYAAGLRILQLTYQRQNAFGSGCGEKRDNGLSQAGRALVARCNEVGIALDASHCGPRTTLEVIEQSAKPVFITHTAVQSFSNHVRTKSDDIIKAVAARGGVVGILTYRVMLANEWRQKMTAEHFVDQLEFVIHTAGEDHVSIGLDFTPDGTESAYRAAAAEFPEIYQGCPFSQKHLEGLASVEHVGSIIGLLEKRGYSRESIRKIMGLNFTRVLAAAGNGA